VTQERLYFGREGEKAAVKFLKKQGYRIIEKNYRNKSGEIDIVAEQDQVLVFVEVKSRADGEYGEPLEAVTPHKQRKIGQVAKGFLTQHRITNRDCRFDVVGIKGDPNTPKTWQIELVPDAFRL
jgi:putative endonuclease